MGKSLHNKIPLKREGMTSVEFLLQVGARERLVGGKYPVRAAREYPRILEAEEEAILQSLVRIPAYAQIPGS